jgi:uncharacterized membrane protein YkgB
MSFFYADPGHYQAHMNPEGTLVPANVEWNEQNHTYAFAYGLGAVIVLYALMLCLHPWLPQVAALGGFLVFVMSLVTLSFLVTTPACWVPPLGDVNHGFPFLSGAGRLVIKDAIMMGASLVVMADSAKAWLRKQRPTAWDSQLTLQTLVTRLNFLAASSLLPRCQSSWYGDTDEETFRPWTGRTPVLADEMCLVAYVLTMDTSFGRLQAPAYFDRLAGLAEAEGGHVMIDILVLARRDQVGLVPDADVAAVADILTKLRPGRQMS